MLSPHPADPTLTTDNIMEVVKEVEHCWEDLGFGLGVPLSKLSDIKDLYKTNHLRMEAVVDYYVKYSPYSWKDFGTTLQLMELHNLADEVTTKYVRGMDVSHVTCWIVKLSTCSRWSIVKSSVKLPSNKWNKLYSCCVT